MAAYDDLDVRRIFVVGISSIVVTAVTALAVQVLYYTLLEWQQSETQAASNYTRQNRILQEQQDQISTYGVDEATGNIVIPVEAAIDLMVGEKAQESSNASTESKRASDET